MADKKSKMSCVSSLIVSNPGQSELDLQSKITAISWVEQVLSVGLCCQNGVAALNKVL
jgi:hypothetical protein